jgi:hypothetical protein
VVISDFLDDGDCTKALQYLADFGHELMLVQVWADEDRTPPWEGELDLEDAETGARLNMTFDASAREDYAKSFDEYSDQIERVAVRNGGRYVGISTGLTVEEAIFGPIIQTRAIQ